MLVRSTPHLSRPVWAGPALAARYGKPGGSPPVGESWEIWRENLLSDGRMLGDVVDFPLLIKLISTEAVLSVQVHPDDATARLHGAPSGKAEAWVVLDAEPDAQVALGLRRSVSRRDLRDMALSGAIEAELAWFPVGAGDVIDVPCGTIHAIGKGVTLYEVQQPADITWRLYDWGRGRELHLNDALEVAKLGPALGPTRPTGRMIDGPLFVVEEAREGDSLGHGWRAVTCVAGALSVRGEHLGMGQSALVPPGWTEVRGGGRGLWAFPG